jgi:hypothetical protein
MDVRVGADRQYVGGATGSPCLQGNRSGRRIGVDCTVDNQWTMRSEGNVSESGLSGNGCSGINRHRAIIANGNIAATADHRLFDILQQKCTRCTLVIDDIDIAADAGIGGS